MIETNRIEYKERLTDNLEKEVVAFLNYIGGGKVYPLLLVRLRYDFYFHFVPIKITQADNLRDFMVFTVLSAMSW